MTEPPVDHGVPSCFSRLRSARAAGLRGAKVGAVVAGGIFVAAIVFTLVSEAWQRWSAGTPLFPFSPKTWGRLVGNFVGGTLVSAAWGGLIGGLIMAIFGACRKDPSRTESVSV